MNCLKYGNKIYKPEVLFNKIRQNPVFFAKKHGITGALLEEVLGINTDKNKILSGVQMSMLSPSDFDTNGNVKPEVLAEIKAEREKIISQAKANGSYMKAPNGQPTKLNKEQWIAVRTQRFKDWFGDWELGAKFKTTRTAESVSEAQSKIKDIVNKPLTNKKLGITATLSNKTLQKLGSEKATKQSVSSDLHALAIANIDTIFENALIDVTHIDTKNRTGINQIHRIGSAIQNPKNGEYAPVMITLKEYTDPNNGNRIYSVEALDIETKKSAGQLESSSQSNDQSPIADFITKIEKEIEKANNSSKVVDDNGEPLVVYHGTNAEFNTFDINKARKNSSASGKGFYFTRDYDRAKGFGKNIIEVFLNINKPYLGTDNLTKTQKEYLWNTEGVWEDVLSSMGFNGIDNGSVKIAFLPNQIKSATDNVGTYSEGSNDIRYHKGDSQSVNELFNKELEQLRKGQLPAGHIFQLGTPNAILQSAGLPNLPIEMSATRLKNKSEQENHPFDLSEIENLPQAIQNPIVVFDSSTMQGRKVIFTELQHGEKNFVVAIELNKEKGNITINDIRSVYPRNNTQIIRSITNNEATYIDKEKATGWLGRQRFNSAEATQLANRSANIINNFKNPPINSDDNSDIDKIQNILDNATAEPMPKPIETLAEFRKEFDKPVKTPINEIRVKDNVFQKITNTNRKEISGTIRPTLEHPTFIVEDTDGSKLFVKVFNKGGEKNYNVVAVNKNGEVENYLSSVHIKSNNNLKNKIKNGAKLIQPQKRLSDENGSQISSAPNSTNVQNNFKNPPINSDDNSDIEFHIGNGNANTNTTKPKFTPPHQGLAPKSLVKDIANKFKETNGNKAEAFKVLTDSYWFKKLAPQEQANFAENTIIDYLFDWNDKTVENNKAREDWKKQQQSQKDDEYRQQNVFNKSARERRLERMKQREEADKKLRNKKPWISKENVKKFITKVSDRQFNVKRIAHKLGMINTYNRIITRAGSSAKAKRDFEQARNKIFKGLTFEEKSHLDMLIHYRRIIAIDENRESRGLGQIRHQGGQTKDSAREEMDDLRLAIGDEKFNMLNERATLYFAEFKKVLDAQLSAGILSQEQYDSMINIDYQPRLFIEHLLDAEGRLMENSKEYQENNKLGKEIIKKLAEGSFGDQVMDAEWLLSFTVGARNSQIFMNELNQTFVLRDYPEAKAEYDAIQKKPKDEWSKEEQNIVKYFEQLESKVRFPKNKSEDTPRGYRKAYYYENGEAKHFFMEENFYNEWYDVQKGFIENPKLKSLISIISGSSLVKLFATGMNSAFIISNTPRDFAQIVLFSPEYSNNSVLATMQLAKDAVKGIKALIQDDLGNQDTLLAKYIEYGGGMDFLHTQGLGDMRNGIAKAMEKILPPNFRDKFLFGLDTISLLKLSRYSETMFRLGVFQRSLNNQLKEYNKLNGTSYKSVEELPNETTKKDMYIGATASARSVLDFNQGGTITKDLEALVPYINAGVQGTRVAVDAFIQRPKQTTSRILQAGAFFGGMPFGISMLLNSLLSDDEDDKTAIEKVLEAYDGISQHQRINYFNIVVPGKMENGEYRVIKIAKTQAITPVAYFMEEMMLNMFRRDEDKRGAGEIISGVAEAFNKNMSPIDLPKGIKPSDFANAATGTASRIPVLKGVMSATTGWDFFRNQPLDPTTAGKNLPLELEGIKNDKVEAFYKAFGEISGESPVRTKAMVESLITSPDTNPFITFVYGTLEGVARSGDFASNFTEYFFDEKQGALVRRMLSETNEYNRMARDKERTKSKVDELIVKNEKARNKINEVAKKMGEGRITIDEVLSTLQKMSNGDKDLLDKYAKQLTDKLERKDVDSRVWDIKYSTANSDEAKAYLIYEYYGDFSKEKNPNEAIMQLKENGVFTDNIEKEYLKYLSGNNK